MSEKARRVMSLMGRKQTFAVQTGMSALPPKADIAFALRMSALCQKRTWPLKRRKDINRRGEAVQ